MDLDYLVAVHRLKKVASPCLCGEERRAAHFLSVDAEERFVCPSCETAFYYDRTVLLKSPSEPAWEWVPLTQRAAVAQYGMLGATITTRNRRPAIRVESVGGSVWVADCAVALRLDRPGQYAERTATAIEMALCQVVRSSGQITKLVTTPNLKKTDALSDLLPAPIRRLLTSLYPCADWWAGDVFYVGFDGGTPVAVVSKPERDR